MSDERPPLIYLPGLDGTGRLLHRQPQLFERYRVDCRSYPQDRRTTYDELAADTLEAIRRLGGRAILLAESFGGAVALRVARDRPEAVERLVLVNTFARHPQRLLMRLAAWLSRDAPDKPAHPATRIWRGQFFFARDISAAERQVWWTRTPGVSMLAQARRIRMIATLDMLADLPKIRTPALVVAATDDWVVPPIAGRVLAKGLPNAKLVEVRAGHAALIHPSVNIAELLGRLTDGSASE